MVLERDIEERVCEYALDELGVINVKIKAAGHRGWPDRLFFIPGGRGLFIEFKRPGDGELSKLQKVIIRRLKHYDYDVEVCETFEGAVAAIERALDAARLPKEGRQVPARTRRRDPIA